MHIVNLGIHTDFFSAIKNLEVSRMKYKYVVDSTYIKVVISRDTTTFITLHQKNKQKNLFCDIKHSHLVLKHSQTGNEFSSKLNLLICHVHVCIFILENYENQRLRQSTATEIYV